MSTVTQLHYAAMDYAEAAVLWKRHGNQDLYRLNSLHAFSLEKQAAEILKDDLDKEPSRSILYRSAAWLAIDCEEYDQAIALAQTGLAGKPPEMSVNELECVLRAAQKAKENKKA